MNNELSKEEAVKQDRNGEFHIDDAEGFYGVFGSNSGFCYATFADKTEAEGYARALKVFS